MSMIKNLLMDKEFFESEEEVATFLEGKDIDDNSSIQSLKFDKEVFETRAEATEWASTHWFSIENVEEQDKTFDVIQWETDDFLDGTLKDIEVRRGIVASIGVLRPLTSDCCFFKDEEKNVCRGTVDLGKKNIKFSENLPNVIEYAKVVEGFHPAFGKVEITKEMLDSFVRNFNEGVVGVDLAIDFDHETREAAGWIKSIFLDIDDTTLLAEVRWTPGGALSLSSKEFRYFSPEFSLNFVHPHTLVEHGPTILGGGLVNRPFLKMDAIVELKDKGELEMETIKLSEHSAIKLKLDKEISDLKLSLVTSETKVTEVQALNTKLSGELKTHIEEKEAAEKVAKYQKLFDENKINAAQLTALKEGKEPLEVLALSETLNPNPKGKDGEVVDGSVVLSADEKAICLKMNLTEDEFISANYPDAKIPAKKKEA